MAQNANALFVRQGGGVKRTSFNYAIYVVNTIVDKTPFVLCSSLTLHYTRVCANARYYVACAISGSRIGTCSHSSSQ